MIKIKTDFRAVNRMLKGLKKELGKGKNGAKAGYVKGQPRKPGEGETSAPATMDEVALFNEFGAVVHIPEHKRTITTYKEVNKAKTGFNKEGKFVKKGRSNFAQTFEDVVIPAHTVNIPPRPFLRNAQKKAAQRGAEIVQAGLNAGLSMGAIMKNVAEGLQDLIVESIEDNIPPENAESTVAKKGSTHTLIDTGQLRASVHAAQVVDGKEKMLGEN